jgi:outer membrane protein assembly complex protein YaeT
MCALALCAAAAGAQVAQFENRRIVDIQFHPAQPLAPADLARALPFHRGDPLHADDVANAIDALFATGAFRDIVVEAEPSGTGVVVHFRTQVTWFIGSVDFTGRVSAPPSRPQMRSVTQLNLGAPFNDEDLTHAQSALADLLKANGMIDSSVTPELRRELDTQQIFITFRVKERGRARYTTPVIRGRTILSDSTIIRATGWRLPIVHWWRRVTALNTRSGVQGVLARYRKQDRLKAKVDLERLDFEGTRRVRPTLNITPGPRIRVEAVETSVSRRTLKRYVPVFQEHSVDNDLLAEGKRNLIDYFQGLGYYDVDIDFRVLPERNDQQKIEYFISRGQRYKVSRVTVQGNRYFQLRAIRERMYMQPASFALRHGRFSEVFRRKDESSITDLYRANGFRDVKVSTTVDRSGAGTTAHIAVTVHIEEGPQWLVETMNLDGVEQGSREALVSRLSSVAGEPFADVNLAADRNELLTWYFQQGFRAAQVDAAWTPAAEPHRVHVTYNVKEGERNFVRRVIYTGLRTTRPSVVEKRITLKPGDPLSPNEQIAIQKRLYDLGIFARVDTAIQNPDGDTAYKYVLYSLEEANRYSIGIGLGAQVGRFGSPSTDVIPPPNGSAGFSPLVSLDVARLNFLGRGHLIGLHGLYSRFEKRGALTYEIPNFMDVAGRDLKFSVLYDNSFNVQTFASKRAEAAVQFSDRLSKTVRIQLRYAYRRVSVSDVVIPVLLVPQLQQPVRIGIVSASLVQDRRNDVVDPHRGMLNAVDIGLAASFFGAQRNFGRILLRNATYHPLTRTIVLARQTQLGVIIPFWLPPGVQSEQAVPLPERFFGGGPDTLRAFPFNQAGPRDTGAPLVAGGTASQPTGLPLGGNALFYNNLELRFPLVGSNLYGVLFHDMGNVFSTLGDFSLRFHQTSLQDFDYTVHAVGFGVRYKTPLGPIRLDLAYSVNPPSYIGFNGTLTQLYQCNPNVIVTTGPCATGVQNVSHFQFFFSIGQTF